ncbi:MBL fold metallo-hydrolase, partial [Candidatus Aerophobetes bacterium]|nr:MBL fold metallo-hydrolase [Candidatus Aerophobetes bacterium]
LSDPQLNLSSLLQVPYTFPHPERLLEDGDCIHLEGMTLEVLHTPGHTPGSICLSYDDILFTGDTLFAGGVGRVDFPGGNLQLLLSSIKRRIFSLPETMKVLPGHGPESTIEKEKRENFFLK